MPITTATQGSSLADILERVLDKGIVIAGDITIALADVDLLKIRIRLLIASVDKAEEIGINWWRTDPALSGGAGELDRLREENALLRQRLEAMEQRIMGLAAGTSAPSAPPTSPTHPDATDD
ncbi:MAG: gas vesicle protein [Chloroflexi bacterium]|nr:gas vesicle protein [Chloroflexota bacterium]